MGITGLLPFLKKVSRPANIKDFKGCTVAIDSYCWLHRGAFACAEKLALGEKTDQYVYYCMKYVNNLLSFGIRPIMVFDGCHLPSKREVEKSRRERREMNRKKASQLLREGKRNEARECLQRCVDISPQMALELMNACRAKGVDCIVAPYEADAQLAYLSKAGIAQVIITEDSDLILFGCERIMFKMDFAGNGNLVEKESLSKAMDLKPDCYTFEKFRYMCILSGCDYLASLPGIGLVKANKVFKLTRQTDMNLVLRKLPTTLKMSNLTVPNEYVQGFFRADNTFLYQLVYDPCKRRLVPLHPYPDDADPREMDYAGSEIKPEKALQIALGNIDIYTGQKIADFDPDTFSRKFANRKDNPHGNNAKEMLHMLSIWDKNYRPMPHNWKVKDPCSVDRPCTRGKEVTVKSSKVKANRKSSPVKRPRPVETEDDKESMKRELAASYGLDPEQSPAPKRRKSEPPNLNSGMLPKRNLSFLDSYKYKNDKQVETDTEVQKVKFNVDVTFEERPEKINEIITDKKLQSSEDTLDKSVKEVEGNVTSIQSGPSPSPRKNKFAVLSKSRKPKFDLNAKKSKEIVKSRFFAAADEPLQKTKFFNSLDVVHGSKESEVNEEKSISDEDEPVAGEPDTPPAKETAGNYLPVPSNSRKGSPYGCFGRSEKLRKFSSSSQKVGELSSSQEANNQFKPVIRRTESSSQKSLDSSCSSPQSSTRDISETSLSISKPEPNASQAFISDDEDKENNSQETRASFTLETDLCDFEEDASMSQDSKIERESLSCSPESSYENQNKFSLLDSKSSVTRTKSANSIFKLTAKSSFSYPVKNRQSLDSCKYFDQKDPNKDNGKSPGERNDTEQIAVLDLTADENSKHTTPSCESTSNRDIGSSQGSASSSAGSKILGGCRNSGLSKKSSSFKNTPSGKAQPAITNFFSQYAFQKSGSTKPPSLRKPLKESPDKNIISGATPETHSLLLQTGGTKVQRKLSLS